MLRAAWLVLAVTSVGVASGGEANRQALDLRTPDGDVLVAADEIVAYEWASHTLTLKPGVSKTLFNKLRTTLAPGQPFVVAVGGKTVYEGRMTSVASSVSQRTAVIVVDAGSYYPALGEDRVRIDLGYPGRNFFKGEDPRADPRIEAALKAAGKLNSTAAPKSVGPGEYLKVLREFAKKQPAYTAGADGPSLRPANEQDLPGLFKLLESREKCAATMQIGSSFYPETGSTVGHEAGVLIDSFRTGKRYPIANTSTQHRVDREAVRAWWKQREKEAK